MKLKILNTKALILLMFFISITTCNAGEIIFQNKTGVNLTAQQSDNYGFQFDWSKYNSFNILGGKSVAVNLSFETIGFSSSQQHSGKIIYTLTDPQGDSIDIVYSAAPNNSSASTPGGRAIFVSPLPAGYWSHSSLENGYVFGSKYGITTDDGCNAAQNSYGCPGNVTTVVIGG